MKRRDFIRSAMYGSGAVAFSPWLRAASTEVNALTIDGKQLSLDAMEIKDLAAGLRGPLLLPGNAAYDKARQVLNPTIDKHPAARYQQ